MAYSIMRLEKIKCKTSFSAIERHGVDRGRLAHRTHPERSSLNVWYDHGYDREKSLLERFDALVDGLSYRKDAVLGYHIVLAYSPEAEPFLDQSAWIAANRSWLASVFGDQNVISVRYDVDETTPHLHAVVVPLVDGRLCAKHFTGGKEKLSALQDSYSAAMAPLGLERGRSYRDEPSKPSPSHCSLKEYWRDVDAADAHVRDLERDIFG